MLPGVVFLRRIEDAGRAFGKRECINKSQITSDILNTPSLIRTIPSVPEFHRTPCFRTRGLSPPIGNSCFPNAAARKKVTLP
jgi:hypothetical protein